MRVIIVVKINPFKNRLLKFAERISILKPTTFFFDCVHKMFCFGIVFGIAKAGENLMNSCRGTILQKSQAGQRTAVIADQL